MHHDRGYSKHRNRVLLFMESRYEMGADLHNMEGYQGNRISMPSVLEDSIMRVVLGEGKI